MLLSRATLSIPASLRSASFHGSVPVSPLSDELTKAPVSDECFASFERQKSASFPKLYGSKVITQEESNAFGMLAALSAGLVLRVEATC